MRIFMCENPACVWRGQLVEAPPVFSSISSVHAPGLVERPRIFCECGWEPTTMTFREVKGGPEVPSMPEGSSGVRAGVSDVLREEEHPAGSFGQNPRPYPHDVWRCPDYRLGLAVSRGLKDGPGFECPKHPECYARGRLAGEERDSESS